MRPLWRGIHREWVRAVSSVMGLGYSPLAPGTLGSLAGLGLAWTAYPALIYLLFLLTLLGFSVCKASEILYGSKDPQRFVMDEVCGVLLSVLWLPHELWIFILAFTFFRVFDIFKPWIIRELQNQHHPHSIMWDDLAAGFFANVVTQFLVRFLI